MTTVRAVVVDDVAAFDQWYAVYEAATRDPWATPWHRDELLVAWRDHDPYERSDWLLALDDAGEPVGQAQLEMSLQDNRHVAFAQLRIRPDRRREGHGTALLDEVVAVARGAGRTSLLVEGSWGVGDDHPPAKAFARHHGFRLDLLDAHRVLDLPALVPDAPVAEPYRIVSWRGRCPDDWVEEYARVCAQFAVEAPTGELTYEQEHYDAARIRHEEDKHRRQRRVMQVCAAVDADGALVGHTQLVFPHLDVDANVYQWDTLVLPAHRGHGLGLSLKAEAMHETADLLAGRKVVNTYNAVQNTPMIAVNEAMGYRLIAYNGEFVREI